MGEALHACEGQVFIAFTLPRSLLPRYTFTFTTRPVPALTAMKRMVVKTVVNTEAKKLKKEAKNLESNED